MIEVTPPTMPPSKPVLSTLQTSKTGKPTSFPSQLPRTPVSGGAADVIKQEDLFKTPITPPTAYMDFLKAVSPRSTLGPGEDKSGKTTPTITFGSAASSSASSSSSSSASSTCTCKCEKGQQAAAAPPSSATVPPSPHSRHPQSAPATSAPRRLRIPSSAVSPIYSPTSTASPMSARSVRSPFSAHSPRQWELGSRPTCGMRRRSLDQGFKSNRPVSVRQIVTRTITYTPQMNLEPAPKGKKRRME